MVSLATASLADKASPGTMADSRAEARSQK
jgi:hypothetical protein